MLQLHRVYAVTTVALLGLLLAACPMPEVPFAPEVVEEPAISEVTYTATDDAFSGPDSIPTGWTQIELVNEGTDLSHGQLLRLPEDRTLDDLMAAIQEGHPPEWLAYAGGPTAVVPGESTAAIVDLQPGLHVMVSFIPDAAGVPGIARGLLKPINVTPTDARAAPEPEADITIELLDFAFEFPDELAAGTYTIHTVNPGQHPHEAVLVRLAPGATVEDFVAAFAPDAPPGPPPGMPVGGVQVIDPGDHAYFTVELGPGRYGIVCFHPEPETGLPHTALGMLVEFTVE